MSPQLRLICTQGWYYIYICMYVCIKQQVQETGHVSLPTHVHSFIACGRTWVPRAPASQWSFTSIQMVHTYIYIYMCVCIHHESKKGDSGTSLQLTIRFYQIFGYQNMFRSTPFVGVARRWESICMFGPFPKPRPQQDRWGLDRSSASVPLAARRLYDQGETGACSHKAEGSWRTIWFTLWLF